MRVVLVLMLCLVLVFCGSKKKERMCKKNMAMLASKCVAKGYQPPSEISCNFDVLTPNGRKKNKKIKYNKAKCTKASDFCVENCPEAHCGGTTSSSTPPAITSVPCPGSVSYSYGTSNPTGAPGHPCVPSVPTTPEGGWKDKE